MALRGDFPIHKTEKTEAVLVILATLVVFLSSAVQIILKGDGEYRKLLSPYYAQDCYFFSRRNQVREDLVIVLEHGFKLFALPLAERRGLFCVLSP